MVDMMLRFALAALFVTAVSAQDPTKSLPESYAVQFENDYVQVVRVHYDAGAKLPHFETIAEQQAERVQQDRLARAGFAGEHRESLAEFDIERGDDDKVANRKRAEHGNGGAEQGQTRLRDGDRIDERVPINRV